MTTPTSVILGKYGADLLQHRGPEHVLLCGPTRSGKGVSTVVTTLLSYGGSVVVYDVKSENWAITAGWRQTFSHTLWFNPTNSQSAHYNPLLEIRKGMNEVRDTQNVADILVDPEGANDRRDHWAATAHGLLVGSILHVLYAEQGKHLAGLASFLSDPTRSMDETLQAMLCTQHLPSGPHPVVAAEARAMLNRSPNERSGVLSTALSFLQLYRDPLVARTTAASDFALSDLQYAAHPVSLYLVTPPSDISRTKGLMRLILNQMGRRLTEQLDVSDTAHPLLILLDEFPSLGHLSFFETSLAFLAGYKIRALLVSQSLNQLDKIYGVNNAILDNCHCRIFFSTNDERTAKRVSDLCGTATQARQQTSLSGGRFSLFYNHASTAEVLAARPLLTPGEVMSLPAEDVLVLTGSTPPIRARKLRYYGEPCFQARLLPPPDLQVLDVPPHVPSPWLSEKPKPVLRPAPVPMEV